MKLLNQEQTLSLAAAKSGMDEKTARKYRRLRKLPSEMNKERDWRTREDSFKEMWEKVRSKLELNPGLQAKTQLLFFTLNREDFSFVIHLDRQPEHVNNFGTLASCI